MNRYLNKEKTMRQLFTNFMQRFEAMAMAVAFAEAGEWSTAESMIERKQQRSVADKRKDNQKRKRPAMRA
jgi:hypothetical protein